MTISSNLVFEQWTGNGSATTFAYSMRIIAPDDVRLYEFTIATETLVSINPAAFTITGVGPNTPGGGTITYNPGTPLPNTKKLYLYRISDFLQETQILNQGGFMPQVVETALDELTSQSQFIRYEELRSLKFPLFDTASVVLPSAIQRGGRYLAFAGDGSITTAAGLVDGNLVTVGATPYTVTAGNRGSLLRWNSASLATWTLPNHLDVGFEVAAVAVSTGMIKFVPAAGATLTSPYDSGATFYNGTGITKAIVHLYVDSNATSTSAVWVLNGALQVIP